VSTPGTLRQEKLGATVVEYCWDSDANAVYIVHYRSITNAIYS